ncbi:MAG: hypothetical protein FJZ57_05400 [Chlamydiae bacterium]|nr:hypothetical protein [Chlamydiota bacterium]
MKFLRIANPQFEIELENDKTHNFIDSFHLHPIFLQLQYLSYLYGDESDFVLTTHHPEEGYLKRLANLGISPPRGLLLDSCYLPDMPIDCWGYTPSLKKWAEVKNKTFTYPNLDVVKKVNRKDFSFLISPKLSGSKILTNLEEVKLWIEETPGTKVAKSVFGLSGRGHIFLTDDITDRAISFFIKQWKKKLPIIGEPWVDRILDFSTQWIIHKDKTVDYIGPTICCNDAKGSYQKTIILPNESIGENFDPFLKIHKDVCKTILNYLASLDFYGNVGIDAMIYNEKGALKLHPVVEINARKTMGYVALMLQRKHFAENKLCLSYTNDRKEDNLLPNFATTNTGHSIQFSKVLRLEKLY